MNIGPEQPVDREPLTPEERELAQRLSRLGPSAGPPSTVDARILAAAHDAVAAAHPRGAGRGTRRWPVALGVAASMALAVGIAWRLRPLPEPPPVRLESAAASVETTAAAAPTAAAPTTVIAPAPGPAADADSPALQKEQRSAPAAAPQDAAKAQPSRESAPPAPAEAEAVSDAARAADVAAPPPPPAPPAPQPLSAAAEAASADAAATGAAAASEESKRLSDSIEVSGTVQRTQSVAAPRAASVQAPVAPQREPQSFEDIEIVGVDDSGDEPPAYANSPQVREAWLQRIRELIAEGHQQQARDSLDEFQRRYPDQALPDDLQRFQQSKPDPAAP